MRPSRTSIALPPTTPAAPANASKRRVTDTHPRCASAGRGTVAATSARDRTKEDLGETTRMPRVTRSNGSRRHARREPAGSAGVVLDDEGDLADDRNLLALGDLIHPHAPLVLVEREVRRRPSVLQRAKEGRQLATLRREGDDVSRLEPARWDRAALAVDREVPVGYPL